MDNPLERVFGWVRPGNDSRGGEIIRAVRMLTRAGAEPGFG